MYTKTQNNRKYISSFNELSSIRILFTACGPTTIRSRVRAIVIDTFNRRLIFAESLDMFKIRSMHLISEFFKRIPHALDSTATVILKAPYIFITSATENTSIQRIKSRIAHAVSTHIHTPARSLMATARSGVSLTQEFSTDDRIVAAITCAEPQGITPFVTTIKFAYHQKSKAFADHFNRFRSSLRSVADAHGTIIHMLTLKASI